MSEIDPVAVSSGDRVLAPKVVDHPESIAWDDADDIIVVGFGGTVDHGNSDRE